MTNELTDDARAVVNRVRTEGIVVVPVQDYGWPNAVELALVDAVLSIRARYGTATTGVLGRVNRYRAAFGDESVDDLRLLVKRDPAVLERMFGTQRSAHRLKTAIIKDVAERLLEVGVVHAADVRPEVERQQRAWTDTKGLGSVTWEYFTMLLGQPGVKADTMIRRFAAGALDLESIEDRRARDAVVTAAEHLGVSATDLDHAIWRSVSGRSPRRL